MSDTTITFNTENGIEYYELPEFEYDINQLFTIEGKLKIHINGDLRETYVTDMKIIDRTREFVVDEKETYISYQVEFYNYEEFITMETLTQSDIKENH
jgi:hypothetical protein